jgi:hypothetical protein
VVTPYRFVPHPSYVDAVDNLGDRADGADLDDAEQTVVLEGLALHDALASEELPSPRTGSRGSDDLGTRMTRRFFTLCESPRTRERTMRVLRSSADSAVGGRLLVAFLSRGVFGPLLRSGRIDHATARVELACAQLGGVAVLRYVTRMEPVASMDLEDLVAMVGPSVHLTLTSPRHN